ncbi:coiled-coil domain-containing protein 178-like [Pecten maximus]|uniref:coiled-coil domain-containing protein 178-like n=1 Tax=Pecten maximus TaxID=6579 RepID=UPI001458A547|nr:coiled-coil domain-containing protein 178-like [Pecten maximus]XP_033736854.1 coiled-coil domain-containing protein 178-like [Pecten maximus]
MSMTKVVRLEDVEPRETFSSQYTQSKSALLASSQSLQVVSTSGSDQDPNDLELIEAEDKVYPLPENWPKIQKLLRRKSCELVHTTSPCVKKAVSHLELIQNIIEEWFREREEETRSCTSFVHEAGSRKQLRFARSSEDGSKFLNSAKSRSSLASVPSSAGSLAIRGTGATKDEDYGGLDVPFLGAEEVVDEVITLLARLENDRQEVINKLEQEKEKVIRLNGKIDRLCLKRLVEMPAVVQKEHEACIMDLNELQWHVAYATRNDKRMKDRCNIAEVLNSRLIEDIAFVKKHIPLVEEKLELELEAMARIKNAQTETVTELDTTTQRQEKTASKSNEALQKADTERSHIKRELDTVKDELTTISEELSEAKMTHNAYTHQINDTEQQLKDNEQELTVLEVRYENAKVAEEMQSRKVSELQSKISEAEFERERLENENASLLQEMNSKKNSNNLKIAELENKVKQHDSKLRTILLKNQEAEMEVHDYQDKIKDCERQKVADEKNVARIHKERMKLQQQMTVTMEEYHKVQHINSSVREQLQNEQEKAFKSEESLKVTVETLRRQVKDEVHTRTVLTARITSDSTELTRAKGETSQRREKAKKVASEVDSLVDDVLVKVKKLRTAKKENDEKKENLTAQLENTKKQHEESHKTFKSKISGIEPHHDHLKNEVLALDKRLDHMSWKTDLMNKQMDDWDREQTTMDRLVSNTQKAITDFNERLEEVNIQLKTSQKLDEDLKSDYENLLARIHANDKNHRDFMEDRQRFLEDSEVDRLRRLDLNKLLASKYRQMQNEFIVMKDQLLNTYEERVKLEEAIKDCKQLQALQQRMHGAMLEYFKYRELYNKSELRRMQSESKINGICVADLQNQMEVALKNITTFMQSEMDGKSARRVAWEMIKKHQDKEEEKERMLGRNLRGASPVIPPIRQQQPVTV